MSLGMHTSINYTLSSQLKPPSFFLPDVGIRLDIRGMFDYLCNKGILIQITFLVKWDMQKRQRLCGEPSTCFLVVGSNPFPPHRSVVCTISKELKLSQLRNTVH